MYFEILSLGFMLLFPQYLNCQENLNSKIVISIQNGNVNEVKNLLDQGASSSSHTGSGMPILSLAIFKGKIRDPLIFLDIIKILIEADADVNAIDQLGRTPLDILMLHIANKKISSSDEELANIKFIFELQKLLLGKGAKHSQDWLDKSKNRFVKDSLIP